MNERKATELPVNEDRFLSLKPSALNKVEKESVVKLALAVLTQRHRAPGEHSAHPATHGRIYGSSWVRKRANFPAGRWRIPNALTVWSKEAQTMATSDIAPNIKLSETQPLYLRSMGKLNS